MGIGAAGRVLVVQFGIRNAECGKKEMKKTGQTESEVRNPAVQYSAVRRI
jgi:hypothetical protein